MPRIRNILPPDKRAERLLLLDFNGRITKDDRETVVRNIDVINGEIINILLTSKEDTTSTGERPFEPEFGADVVNLVWDPIDERTAFLIESRIFGSLRRWLPHIILDSSTRVTPQPDLPGFDIYVAWRLEAGLSLTGELDFLLERTAR